MYFHVKLTKRVPHGAGLGGGSGNAATSLFAANRLMGSPATNEELLEWSGQIGSDISVFFSNGAAYCTGRGEVVEDVAPPVPLETPMLLVGDSELVARLTSGSGVASSRLRWDSFHGKGACCGPVYGLTWWHL